MKKIFFILLTLLPLRIFATTTSSSGTRNGGNMSVAAFYQMAQNLLQALAPQSPLRVGGKTVDIKILQSNLDILKVDSSPQALILRGQSVDAINYPNEKRIEFYETRWQTMDDAQRAQLVLHELLGVFAPERRGIPSLIEPHAVRRQKFLFRQPSFCK